VRPLDFLHSIKLKLGVVIVAAVLVTVGVVRLGERLGLSPLIGGFAAAAFALAVVQVLAHGMTSPLREMVAAARAMARGDYSRRITSTSRDEVGELARAFNMMASELDETDRMRRDLVANASHELRTPIGALRARLENLVDGVEPLTPQATAEMLAQVERLGSLVEQLLDLSKLESGAVPLELTNVPARSLLERLASDWREPASERDVMLLTSTAPPNLEVGVDEQRMGQVLSNLVGNAVRHSPEGGKVRVDVTARPGRLRIAVSDQGPGIAADEIERVFERFYRSVRARSADRGGAGLGLAIARWIVELHGGSIHAEQAEPTGCRMVVELPSAGRPASAGRPGFPL
jgi:signal transduction histidine kinase